MGDTPTQRELRSEFDRILAAHERRARLITQLHSAGAIFVALGCLLAVLG
jgi:hypothetical protein